MASTGIMAEFVRAGALMDMVRLASGSEGSSLFSMPRGDGYRLLLPAEKVGKNTVVVYCDTDSVGNYCIYSNRERESFEFGRSAPSSQDLQTKKLRIIEIEGDPFALPAAKEEINMLKLRHYEDLVKTLVYRSASEQEPVQSVYCFKSEGRALVCAFNPVDRDTQVLVYAELEKDNPFSFFRYNYTQDSVAMVSAVGRDTDFYVPVINLAEPFRFFREGKTKAKPASPR